MSSREFPPITPGEVLHEEFLEPMGLSQYRLAKEIHVSPRRINEIVKGTRAITADTALRLGRYFGTSAQLWVNLQSSYDLVERRLDGENHNVWFSNVGRWSPPMSRMQWFRGYLEFCDGSDFCCIPLDRQLFTRLL